MTYYDDKDAKLSCGNITFIKKCVSYAFNWNLFKLMIIIVSTYSHGLVHYEITVLIKKTNFWFKLKYREFL